MPRAVLVCLKFSTSIYKTHFVLCLQIVLDSDDPLFGGFKRLDKDAEYFSSVRKFSQVCYLNLVSSSSVFHWAIPCKY